MEIRTFKILFFAVCFFLLCHIGHTETSHFRTFKNQEKTTFVKEKALTKAPTSSKKNSSLESPFSLSGVSPNDGTSFVSEPEIVKPSLHIWELGLGLPDFIAVRLKTDLHPNDYLGVSLGYFPLSFFLPGAQKEISQHFNDRFDAAILPRANTFSTSIFYQYFWRDHVFFEPQINLLVLNGGGQFYLVDPDTKLSTRIADFDFTLYQTFLSLVMGYSWGHSRTEPHFEVGGGLSVVLTTAVQTQVRGMLPAFLAVAPEYKTSFVDGTSELEADFMDALKRSDYYKKVWPAAFVRWSW